MNKNIVIVAVVALLIAASIGLILILEEDEKEPPITILAQVNSEGSAIFVKGSINDKNDFGGKVFGTPGPASIQHMILADYIATETDFDFRLDPGSGYSNNVVYWTQVGPVNMKEFLADGKIDGGIAWEPYNSQIINEVAGAKIYKWSDEIWDAHPCCVLAVNSKFEKKNPEAVQKFVAAHVVASTWIMDTLQDTTSDNYSYMIDIASKFAFGDNSTANKAIAQDSIDRVTFDHNINASWMESLETVIETYTRLGLFDKNPDQLGYDSAADLVNELVNIDYLANASATETVDPSESLIEVKVGWLAGDIHQLARLVAMDKNIGEGLGFGDRTIFEAFGLKVVGGPGNPYANGGVVMTAFLADEIDFGYLGSPPAILNSVNHLA